MVLEILTSLIQIDTAYLLLILIIFAVFVLLMKKVIKTVINMLWIALASAAFPFVLNMLIGMSLPINLNTIILFVTIGIGMYFIYLLGKIIYTMLSVAEKGAKAVAYPITYRSRKKKEEVEKKMGEFIQERDEQQKEAEKQEKEAEKQEKEQEKQKKELEKQGKEQKD